MWSWKRYLWQLLHFIELCIERQQTTPSFSLCVNKVLTYLGSACPSVWIAWISPSLSLSVKRSLTYYLPLSERWYYRLIDQCDWTFNMYSVSSLRLSHLSAGTITNHYKVRDHKNTALPEHGNKEESTSSLMVTCSTIDLYRAGFQMGKKTFRNHGKFWKQLESGQKTPLKAKSWAGQWSETI